MVPELSLHDERLRAWALIKKLVSYHPGMFSISIGGASVFALCTVASSWALRWVIDEAVLPRFEDGTSEFSVVLTGIGLLIVIALTRAGGVIVRRTWAGMAEWRTAESITAEVVDRLTVQPAPWHRRQRTGDLITRAGVDVEAAVAVMAPLPYASSVILMMLVAAIGLIALDVVLGVIAVAVFPILIVANIEYQRRVDTWFDRAQGELGMLSSAALESFEAITVVKAFGAEYSETRRLADIAARVREARVRAIRIRSWFEALLDLLPNISSVLVIVVGVNRVESGHLSIGGLASFIYLFALLVFPLRLIGYALSELPRSQAGHARIRSVMNQPITADPRSSIRRVAGIDRSDSETSRLEAQACLRLGGVSARHIEPDAESDAASQESTDSSIDDLHDVDMEVPCGTVVAIVGPTGCGKTTLIEVIAGVLPTSAGYVEAPVDSTAVVFQEPFLLGATIADNVAMGRTPDETRDRELIRWSLEVAEASFVGELPNGIDTIVGERGVSLSGGQRQRVALARAIYGRPRLLVLDDTTSALDPVTEGKVIDNLRRELPGTTIVSVASRPSLIRIADAVVYMENGSIRARGTHEELMANTIAYAELISAYERDRGDRHGRL